MPSARALVCLVGVLLCVLPLVPAAGAAAFDVAEYDTATHMLLCDCGCHPQSVHDCACGRAAEMRVEIHGLISQGMSGEEVITQYVDRIGDHIRIVPTARGFNLVAWLGPLFALLTGSVLTLLLIRRWTRHTDSAATATPAAPAAARDEVYEQRLRDALENLE